MKAADVRAILDQVRYRDWRFHFHAGIGVWWIQIRFVDPNDGGEQHSRKWRLSRHMTRSEIVQTCFKAVMAAEEHEARERFQYRGEAIFGPHFDVDDLWALKRAGSCGARTEDIAAELHRLADDGCPHIAE